jgi:nitrilase
MQSFRAAVIQTASAGFDAARSIDKLAGLISEAAAKGVKLAVLPEAFIGGYPKGLDFGVRIGSRTAEGREWFRIYYEGAMRSQQRTIFIS